MIKILENYILSSMPIEVSDFPNHKEVTFLISVLDEYNENGVLIQEEEGEKYHSTIIGYPILASLKYDKKGNPDDFGGHEVKKKINQKTKKIESYFATHAIGSVISSWIEEREVEGYEGLKKVIMIKTKLWKSRFPEYFKVFDKLWDKGGVSSSWEISSSESEKTSKGKVLKAFEFIGNCLLGSNVKGAVRGAGALEVASEEDEFECELSNAFLEDIKNENTDNLLSEPENIDLNGDDNLNNIEGGFKKVDIQTSAVTHDDLWNKVRRAINNANSEKYYYVSLIYPYDYKAIAYNWDRQSQEDFISFSYTVNSDDTVSISSQEEVKMKFVPVSEIEAQVSELESKISSIEKEFSEAGKAVAELTKTKEDLESQITELSQYKVKADELEQAEKDRELAEKKEELKTFAVKDELISSEELDTDEKLSSIFSELTLETFELSQEKIEVIKGRRAIEKFKASKLEDQNKEIEVSAKQEFKNTKADLNNGDSNSILVSAKDIVKSMLNKK